MKRIKKLTFNLPNHKKLVSNGRDNLILFYILQLYTVATVRDFYTSTFQIDHLQSTRNSFWQTLFF